MWVLIRIDDDKYVARPGSEHSYTKKLEEAQVFPTKENAERHKCGNETARTVASVMGAE